MNWIRTLTSIVAGLCLALAGASAQAQGHLDLGSLAPPLYGTDIHGRDLSLADLRGKWVFIDFWATWCAPCMAELPEVVGLENRLNQRPDFDVISVSLDSNDTLQQLYQVVQDYQIPYPVVYSGDGGASAVIADWHVRQIPSTFLIDPNGLIVARDLAPQEVEDRLPLLQESAYRPISLQSHNQLKNFSALSGLEQYRDLHIDIEMKEGDPPISRYKLYISTTCPYHQAGMEHADVLYDLRIAEIERDGGTRYAVDIRKTSGASYIEQVSSGAATDASIPNMAIRIDDAGRKYSFIVPVPVCSSQITYAVALYDEQLNDFVRNGMTTLEI